MGENEKENLDGESHFYQEDQTLASELGLQSAEPLEPMQTKASEIR